MAISSPSRADSALFTPISINNGKIRLAHRVILAPLTRNRGTPLKRDGTAEDPNRVWLPNEMMAEYYGQRASKGGMVITEGVPPSLEVCLCVYVCVCVFCNRFLFLIVISLVQYALGRVLLVGGGMTELSPRRYRSLSGIVKFIRWIHDVYRGYLRAAFLVKNKDKHNMTSKQS